MFYILAHDMIVFLAELISWCGVLYDMLFTMTSLILRQLVRLRYEKNTCHTPNSSSWSKVYTTKLVKIANLYCANVQRTGNGRCVYRITRTAGIITRQRTEVACEFLRYSLHIPVRLPTVSPSYMPQKFSRDALS